MDGSRIAAKVAKGYRISARKVGLQHAHYRSDGELNPLRVETLIGVIPASFDANSYRYSQPQKPGQATWTALADPEVTRPGDYLVGDNKTWFLASQDHLLPMTAMLCNEVMSFARPTGLIGVGAISGYGDDVRSEEAPLLTAWPCSMISGLRGETSPLSLPSGPKADSGFNVALPVLPVGLQLQAGDYATDESGSRYMVVATEETHRGWRLKVVLTTV